MLNFELIKKLKDLGYPQSKFGYGQTWIAEKDEYIVLHISTYEGLEDDVTFWQKGLGATSLFSLNNLGKELYFVPKFEDLWKKLPESILGCADLTLSRVYGLYYNESDSFDSDRQNYNEYSENITEAAIEMWIKLKEKELIK